MYDANLEKLVQIRTLLEELDDSILVEQIGKELSSNIPDIMEAVDAFTGSLREYRTTTV